MEYIPALLASLVVAGITISASLLLAGFLGAFNLTTGD